MQKRERIIRADYDLADGTPDPVPVGYLALHEALEQCLPRRLRNVTQHWTGSASEDDEPAFFRQLNRIVKQRRAAERRLAKAFETGVLTAIVRDPRREKWFRIPRSFWGQPYSPPHPFASSPLAAPPRSPLGPYRGRTVLVLQKAFERWQNPGQPRVSEAKSPLSRIKRQPDLRRKPGRPSEYDWPGAEAAMRRLLEVHGKPCQEHGFRDWKSAAGLGRHLADWFDRKISKTPAESLIAEHCARLLEEFDGAA